MINISLLLPTRERSSFVYRLFDSLIETTSCLQEIEFVLYLDEDDPESHSIAHSSLNITKLIRPTGSAMGNITRECYQASQGRYVFLMNDDVVFRTKGWDITVTEAFAKFDDDIALVYGNDLDQGRAVPTFPIMSRKVCELMGNICPKDYLNLHIESHIFDIFNQLKQFGHNRIVYLENVIFEHLHHILGKSERDNVSIKKDTSADDRLFVALAEERKYVAKKLERYIKGKDNTVASVYVNREENASACQSPDVSIILPYFMNNAYLATRTVNVILDNSEATEKHFELIVSTESIDTCNLKQDNVLQVVEAKESSTISQLFNKGVDESRGHVIIFIKPGCIPQPGWIDKLVKVIYSKDDIGVVGSKIVNQRNGRIIHAGIGFFKDNHAIKASHIYRGFKMDNPVVNREREFQAVSGGCFMMRKELFMDIGGFNEILDTMEDIDICLRVKAQGKRIVYTPEVVLYSYGYGYQGQNESGKQQRSSLDEGWAERVQCDLEMLLGEDGFSLCKNGGGYHISPR